MSIFIIFFVVSVTVKLLFWIVRVELILMLLHYRKIFMKRMLLCVTLKSFSRLFRQMFVISIITIFVNLLPIMDLISFFLFFIVRNLRRRSRIRHLHRHLILHPIIDMEVI